ncbi:MAG: hypothetical protein IK118_01585 [Clostridia bacterium]|nr:hypothetical protein [Clostridia bacterium]
MPKYNKKTAKSNNKRERDFIIYFSYEADAKFRRKHPVVYWVYFSACMISLILPMVLFIVFNVVFDAPNSGWMMLGGAGSFILGIGLFHIAAAWGGQYLGHIVTVLCFGIGGAMVAVSELLMFNESLKKLYDEEMVSYYFFGLMFLCLPLFCYLRFRWTLESRIVAKYKIRKRVFRDLKKGKKNYLWYQAVNEEYSLGALYPLNKAFTIVYLPAVFLGVLFGWVRIVSLPLCFCVVSSYVLSVAMTAYADIRDNIETYGKPIILFAWDKNRGGDSSVLNVFALGFLLTAAYCYLSMTADLWNITLPLPKDFLW